VPGKCGTLGKDQQAVSVGPLAFGVGEVVSKISKAGRAEKRVSNGVGDRVGIAVADKWALVGKDDATSMRGRAGSSASAKGEYRLRGQSVVRSFGSPFRKAGEALLEVDEIGEFGNLRFDDSPGTTHTIAPSASTSAASSVASPPSAWARRSTSARKACGVCTATSSSRRSVSVTRVPTTRLIVSATAIPGIAPSAPARTASTTFKNRSGEASGRAASWMTTIAAEAPVAASPARTDADRVGPPETTIEHPP